MRKICLRCGSKFGSQAEYCPHDGSLLATDEELADPLLGNLLLEQFRVDARIGTGGMGTVYRAHQTTVGRDVAIKVLRPELARDEQAVLRFEREARLATSLDHPNLVRVFLTGRLADGRLYIVMELLEGRSLADELEEEGTPSLERALIMIMKLCAGLGAVHDSGIVHRDIKPENIYLVRRGRDEDFVKLVDFGIARVLEGDGIGPSTTQSGRVFGTATYISPEAATGEETDHRSDIYSIGVLSYQLLTGELPFQGKTAGAILMQHVHQEPPLLQSKGRGAEVPDDLAHVVMRSLSKDPDARQQSLAEFLDSLAEAAGHAGLLNDGRALLLGTVWGDELAAPGSYLAELLGGSTPPGVAPGFADTQPVRVSRNANDEALLSSAPKPFGTTGHDLAPRPSSKPRRAGRLWALLGLLALLLIGVVAGTWWRQRTSSAVVVEPIEAPPAPLEEEPLIADVVTDAPIVEPPVLDAAVPNEPEIEPAQLAPEPPPAAKPKPKKKKPKKPRKPKTEPPKPAAEPPPTKTRAVEADEDIDWTVPDFPDEPSAAADAASQAEPSVPAEPPAEPPEASAPTGTPDAPARNPIVIDEPPQ